MTFLKGRFAVAIGLVGAWAGFWSSTLLWAGSGDQFQMEAHDLQLFVDYRWAGTVHGGYYPIRIQVLNKGADCVLTFRFEPYPQQQIPTVERRNLPVRSGTKALITLSVPMVGRGSIGNLEVERDGEPLDQFTRQLSLSHADFHSIRASALIISPYSVQRSALEQGFQFERNAADGRTLLDHQVIEPVLLPNTWADYSGLDFVIIPFRSLADLEADKRAAILNWAQAGGTLVILDLGEPAAVSAELKALLNLPEARQWVNANPLERRRLAFQSQFQPQFPARDLIIDMQTDNDGDPSRWKISPETFVYHDYLLGGVYVFRDNPFPGTPLDWAWWLSTVPKEIASWEARQGVLPRRSNENFFNFLIPGVTSVPVYAFLVLMTLFTIVIGPLNYIFLRRRKRTYLLLLTIPVIAFVTSLTLFVYSTLAYGFSVTSRSRSLTVLDQRTNTAVSLSRISLFAGMAPSKGLTFSPDTAVFPMWAPLQLRNSQFESGRVVWGENQELTDGWLRSRTRTQFTTVQHRTERGRLEIEALSHARLTISNGLEWDIAAILWVDDAGNVYQGPALGAGNTGELELVEPATFATQLKSFREILARNEPLETPNDVEEGKSVDLGLMEYKIQKFLQIPDYGNLDPAQPPGKLSVPILPPRSYLAILADRPGIELGLEDTDEVAGYHLLLGHY